MNGGTEAAGVRIRTRNGYDPWPLAAQRLHGRQGRVVKKRVRRDSKSGSPRRESGSVGIWESLAGAHYLQRYCIMPRRDMACDSRPWLMPCQDMKATAPATAPATASMAPACSSSRPPPFTPAPELRNPLLSPPYIVNF